MGTIYLLAAIVISLPYSSVPGQKPLIDKTTERHLNELRDCKSVFSDALNNPIIRKLHQQYWELVAREADFSVRYGKDHAAVINIRNQMHDIRNSVVNELRRLAESENCPID